MRKSIKCTLFTSSLLMMLTLFSFSKVASQCAFNCNDTINVSVNSMCLATITPDLMLEGDDGACKYAIQIFQEDGISPFPGVDVGMAQVGQTLKVRVFENGRSGGPSCWGYIKVEDKLPPVLVCAGNETLPCFRADPYYTNDLAEAELKRRIQAVGLVDNCNDQDIGILVLENDLDRQYCQDGFSARRIIKYNVLDNDRNVLECQDTISYSQIPLDTLTGPTKRILECGAPYPSVEYMLNRFGESSIPNFNGMALSQYIDSAFIEKEAILCNFKMTYTDILFPTCGSTYKVIREWTVIDWCNSNFPRVINQIIKIQDSSIRIATCSNISNQIASQSTCSATVGLPLPSPINECSEWTFGIYAKDPGESDFILFGSARRRSSSNAVNRSFPLGESMVKYIVTDECGNTAECIFTVTVIDEAPPSAVCDYRTVVTLTDSYLGKAFARTFDDGSFDACSGIVNYKVRRTDRANTDCPSPTDYDDFVKFCCSDIGQRRFVELQVTDGAGLTSVCIAEVRVQFKGEGPSITCPVNVPSQDCQSFATFDISNLIPPTVTSSNPCLADNLIPSIREVGRDIDSCGIGYIDVEWFVNITGVEEIVCTQRIEFINTNIFKRSDITWPADRIINTCGDIQATDLELANLIPDDLSCSNIVASDPVDRRHGATSEACYRITRTWTVVDWCRYPADLSARWSYEQTLTIENTQGPIVNILASALTIIKDDENCRAQISALGIATDDCTASEDLEWTYMITSEGADVLPSASGNEVNTLLTLGSYLLQWSVTDECGNTTRSEEEFTIRDTQAPTITCKAVEISIDETTKDAVLIINDISDNSFDNCDAVLELGMRRLGSNDDFTQLLRFGCQELGVSQVELIGVDDAGSSGSCTAAINVRNLNDACEFGSSAVGVSGTIYNMRNEAVEKVEMQLSQKTQNTYEKQMTDISGGYAFQHIEKDVSYRLIGHKNDDYQNGISTLDIILLQHHILGLRTFDSPSKYLAGDINKNRSISSTDIVLLRRLLLNQIDVFPNSDSWIFVDEKSLSNLNEDDAPWDVPMYVDLRRDLLDNELVGIKIGDLDQNAIANSALARGRSLETYSLVKNVIESSNEIVLEIKSTKELSSMGLQIGLTFDDSKVDLISVKSPLFDIVSDDLHIDAGSLRLSNASLSSKEIQAGDRILTLRFDKKRVDVRDINLELMLDSDLSSEIYSDNYEALQLHLIRDKRSSPEIELLQNKPNPFTDYTIIEFSLPSQQEVSFNLFDLNGKSVFQFNELFVAGSNQISISKEGLGLNKGIYYYQIKTQSRSLIKKMIIL